MLQEVYQLLEDVFGSIEDVEREWAEKQNRIPLLGMLAATVAIMLLSGKIVKCKPSEPESIPAYTSDDLEDD